MRMCKISALNCQYLTSYGLLNNIGVPDVWRRHRVKMRILLYSLTPDTCHHVCFTSRVQKIRQIWEGQVGPLVEMTWNDRMTHGSNAVDSAVVGMMMSVCLSVCGVMHCG